MTPLGPLRSRFEAGPGGTVTGNCMDSHLGVLRTMPLVVRVRYRSEDESQTIEV